jgi:hypothetical protein
MTLQRPFMPQKDGALPRTNADSCAGRQGQNEPGRIIGRAELTAWLQADAGADEAGASDGASQEELIRGVRPTRGCDACANGV